MFVEETLQELKEPNLNNCMQFFFGSLI